MLISLAVHQGNDNYLSKSIKRPMNICFAMLLGTQGNMYVYTHDSWHFNEVMLHELYIL